MEHAQNNEIASLKIQLESANEKIILLSSNIEKLKSDVVVSLHTYFLLLYMINYFYLSSLSLSLSLSLPLCVIIGERGVNGEY